MVFSDDPETHKACLALAEDWRFARVQLRAMEGGVDQAIEYCRANASPSLVIVQTGTIDDAFTAKLADLAAACDEGTAAVVIGPVNDVYLYRHLIDMGVSDYLVRPVLAPVLAEVISKSLVKQLDVAGSRLFAFIGAKGGVGTSAMLQAAAWHIADVLGQKTLVLDAGGGWSALSVGFGYPPSTTMSAAARAAASGDENNITRMLHKAGEKLSILTTGSEPMLEPGASPDQFEYLLNAFMAKYPVILADLSQAPPDLAKIALTRAGEVMLVTTPQLSSLRLARGLLHEIRDLRGGQDKDVSLLVNMRGLNAKSEAPPADLERALEFKIGLTVPYAPKLFGAVESEGLKFSKTKEGQDFLSTVFAPYFESKFVALAARDVAQTLRKPGFLHGLLETLKAKK